MTKQQTFNRWLRDPNNPERVREIEAMAREEKGMNVGGGITQQHTCTPVPTGTITKHEPQDTKR